MQGFNSRENYKKSDRKYVWIKVGMSFFNDTTIRRLERKPNGSTAIFAYIKLLTQACKFDGELRNDDGEPIKREDFYLWFNVPEMDELEKAFDLLIESELIKLIPDKGVYFLRDTETLTGSRTTAADRMKDHRERDQEKEQETDQDKDKPEPAQERDQVTPKSKEKPKKTTTKAKDKRPEEVETSSNVVDIKTGETIVTDPVEIVVKRLNDLTGYHYKATTKTTQRLISARLKEGYTLDDLLKIIDVKASEWLGDIKTRRWLSPDTLFNQSKCEKYLNQANEANAYMFHDDEATETNDTMAYLMEGKP